eukprot:s5475_g1.t2
MEAVLLTHGHADAILGLDSLREVQLAREPAECWTLQAKTPIYATADTVKEIWHHFHYMLPADSGEIAEGPTLRRRASASRIVGGLVPNCVEEFETFQPLPGFEVQPLPVLHGGTYVCMGFRFGMHGEVLYLSDVSKVPDKTMAVLKASRAEVLVVDALLKSGPSYSHFGLAQALELVRALRPKRALLVGMSCQFDHERDNAELRKLRMEGLEVELAFDGLQFDLQMEAALPIPEAEEDGSYELQLPAQTRRTAWLRQLATQKRFMPSPEIRSSKPACQAMDLPGEARAEPSEFVNAYVRLADLLATREPPGDTKARPTSCPSRKKRKLPPPKRKRAKEIPPEPCTCSPSGAVPQASTTTVPAEKVTRVCISSSPEFSRDVYFTEDGHSASDRVADDVGSSPEPVHSDSELSPQLAAEVPGPDDCGSDAAESLPGEVEDVSIVDTVPDIEEQFQLAGRALQWLLCASKDQASVAACWSSAQRAAKRSPRRDVLQELLDESTDNARCHMQVHGVGGLVPCEILAAKGSDGQLKHRRGAYELWRELVRSCDPDNPVWFNIQFARWGAFLEELVKRAEAAYISLEIAKRRASKT